MCVVRQEAEIYKMSFLQKMMQLTGTLIYEVHALSMSKQHTHAEIPMKNLESWQSIKNIVVAGGQNPRGLHEGPASTSGESTTMSQHCK